MFTGSGEYTREKTFGSLTPNALVLSSGILSIDTNVSKLTREDLDRLALEYMNKVPDPIFPVDAASVKKILPQNIKEKSIVGIIWRDYIAVGCIIAKVMQYELSTARILHQTFYNSNQRGIMAVKALVLAHQFLIRYATQLDLDYVVSGCSPMDTTNQLSRILAKEGWRTKGHISIWKVKGVSDG